MIIARAFMLLKFYARFNNFFLSLYIITLKSLSTIFVFMKLKPKAGWSLNQVKMMQHLAN